MIKKKILIVDDHALVAQGTAIILEKMDEIEVVGIAETGGACLKMAASLQPDIILLDCQLPDRFGDEVAAELKNVLPGVHILIFTGIDIERLYNYFLELGVSGILSKESSGEQLKDMIRCIIQNRTVIPLSLFHRMRVTGVKPSGSVQQLDLTDEEVVIMEMVVNGSTAEQVAQEIHVSKRSIDNYLKRIYDKLQVKNRAQAIQKYMVKKNG